MLILEDGRFSLVIDLEGPEVLRLPVPQSGLEPFAPFGKVRLPPGAAYVVPVVRLSEVFADQERYVYWTKPGRCMLAVRLVAGVEGEAAPLTVTTPPIAVQVAAPP